MKLDYSWSGVLLTATNDVEKELLSKVYSAIEDPDGWFKGPFGEEPSHEPIIDLRSDGTQLFISSGE